MSRVNVCLPLPPSVNHCYVTTRHGRRVLKAPGRDWIRGAHMAAMTAARVAGYSWDGGYVRVTLRVFWPDRRRRDVSNLHKLALDAIEGVAYDDDKWALTHDEAPSVDKGQPRLELSWEAAE